MNVYERLESFDYLNNLIDKVRNAVKLLGAKDLKFLWDRERDRGWSGDTDPRLGYGLDCGSLRDTTKEVR